MILQSLTPAEEQLMHVLWTLDKPYLRDIMQALPEPKSHQNTVSTYLKILTEKHYLKPHREGRIFRYEVLIDKSSYADNQIKNLIQDFFGDSKQNLIAYLIPTENQTSPTETTDKPKSKGYSQQDSSKSQISLDTSTSKVNEHTPNHVFKKKSTGKKYKDQIAAFVEGLEKVNKKDKKKKKTKKKKKIKEKRKSDDRQEPKAKK